MSTRQSGPAATVAVLSLKRSLSGGISRMLDMGGSPSGGFHDSKSRFRTVNASKNSPLQCVIFDWNVLKRSMETEQTTTKDDRSQRDSTATNPSVEPSSTVQPDTNKIQQIASLLNVNITEKSGSNRHAGRNEDGQEDDLSLLLTGKAAVVHEKTKQSKKEEDSSTPAVAVGLGGKVDVRSKYASKLAQKGIAGGVVGVERLRQEQQDDRKQGDAAGHLAARKRAMQQPTESNSQWMARTGAGNLLQFLTQRSIKVALLPSSRNVEKEKQQMRDLEKQLPHVIIDLVVDTDTAAPGMLQEALAELKIPSKVVLTVSAQDDYLRAAKDLGCMTCRLRGKNAPRGNVSTPYMAASIEEVKDIVNEINGISFNAVLRGQ